MAGVPLLEPPFGLEEDDLLVVLDGPVAPPLELDGLSNSHPGRPDGCGEQQ